MPLTPKDRVKGGLAVANKYGSKYMSKIGKKGKKKQMSHSASFASKNVRNSPIVRPI